MYGILLYYNIIDFFKIKVSFRYMPWLNICAAVMYAKPIFLFLILTFIPFGLILTLLQADDELLCVVDKCLFEDFPILCAN